MLLSEPVVSMLEVFDLIPILSKRNFIVPKLLGHLIYDVLILRMLLVAGRSFGVAS